MRKVLGNAGSRLGHTLKGDLGFGVAVVGFLFLAGVAWVAMSPSYPYIPTAEYKKAPAAAYSPGSPHGYPSRLNSLPDREAADERYRCEVRAEEHRLRSDDLVQQTRAANAAVAVVHLTYGQSLMGLAGTIAGVLTLVAAAFAAWYARHAAKEGAIANQISRDGIEAQDRAWVAIDFDKPIGFRLVDDETRFVFECNFENVGATPAINFRYFAGLVFGDDARDHVDETLAQFSNGVIDWTEANLFPNRPLHRRISCDHEGHRPSMAKTYLYVAAAYQTVFSEKPRYTVLLFCIQDTRQAGGIIDYNQPPFGGYLHVGTPDNFIGYVT